ncbi:ABC transporter substrate-binding protein [Enterococcus sp. LJL98]
MGVGVWKRKIKPLRMLVFLVLSLGILTACAKEKTGKTVEKEAGGKETVVVALSATSEPKTGLNPIMGWGYGTSPLIQSTLIEMTPEMTFENDLAEKMEKSPDGKRWTFDLREDAKFTNGKPVTAEDVAFTFMELKATPSAANLSKVEKVYAATDKQVVFELSENQSTLMNTISTVGIVPKADYATDYGEHPIGSGPWKFVQWDKGEQIILEANEDYYGKVPSIKRVTFVFMDENAAYAAAQAGEVDAAVTSAVYANQEPIAGMRLEEVKTMDNRGVTLPMSENTGKLSQSDAPVGNAVTSNLAIRQALAYGVNREQLAEEAMHGYADPAYSENDGLPWNNPEVKIEEDQAWAKELLEQDGWKKNAKDGILEKDGLRAAFDLLYLAEDSDRQTVAMAFANQAKELGIEVKVIGKSWEEISQEMFTQAVLMGWGDSNPYTSYLLFDSANKLKDDYYNPEGFSNPVVDQLFEEALKANTEEAAYQGFKDAQWNGETGTSMRGDVPWVWLINARHLYFVKDGLNIGKQALHPHGTSWPFVQNIKDWSWSS